MINARESFRLLPAEGYPWRPVDSAGVVDGHGFTPVTGMTIDSLPGQLDDQLRSRDRPRTGQRTPVLAVGSNRSAEVLRAKFSRAGVSRTVPVMPCRVQQLAIGHLASISLRGYVAAAPLHREGVSSAMVLGWLDDDQLAAMDDTEPGYDRLRLYADDYPIMIGGDSGSVAASKVGVDHAWAYVARRELLARRIDGRLVPVLLAEQTQIHRVLAEVPGLEDLDWGAPAAKIAAMLATDELRKRIPRAVIGSGLSVPGNIIRRSAPLS